MPGDGVQGQNLWEKTQTTVLAYGEDGIQGQNPWDKTTNNSAMLWKR